MAFIIFLAFSLLLHEALGELVCEELTVGRCSFAVSSSGKRCSLETYASRGGTMGVQCRTSEIFANNNIEEYIESDECIRACGLQRKSIGISSDNLLDPRLVAKLCSPNCHHNCPNILDLYSDLALGEGVYLPGICQKVRASSRRAMSQFLSSGEASSSVELISAEARKSASNDKIFSGSLQFHDTSAPPPIPI